MDPRNSYRWKLARQRALRSATHCDICGRELDFDARPRSRWAPSVDHIVPISLGGSPFDPDNLRVAHHGCNSRRGNGVIARSRRLPDRASRVW